MQPPPEVSCFKIGLTVWIGDGHKHIGDEIVRVACRGCVGHLTIPLVALP